jgi:hypothetical protein
LTIAEGRDGRVLLHCFAGCTIDSIASALGIAIHDLFARDGCPNTLLPQTCPIASDVYRALAIEEQRYRIHRRIEGSLRASEVNCIRATVARRYCIDLGPVVRPLFEGAYGGRERDPAWPALFDWALFVASVRLLAAPIAFDETLLPPKSIFIEAEEIAALAMRDLEREARQRPSIAV